MNAIALAPGARRGVLGAVELIELGQAQRTPTAMVSPAPAAPAAPAAAAQLRTIAVSREEGELLVHVLEKIVEFKDSYPIEFVSYCPPDRWQASSTQVVTWTREIERQLRTGAATVAVPAEAVFRLVDLEKCISAARDARLDAAKLAFTFSAVGALADMVFGLSWIGIPAYIAGLAVLFGRPLLAKLNPEPQEPYKPALAGGYKTKCAAPHETAEERARPKLLERIILPPEHGTKVFYWGEVHCVPGGQEGSVCLARGRGRVRVEGWARDIVTPAEGWTFAEDCGGGALNEVGVYETGTPLRRTSFGPLWKSSRHPESFWVEYIGPNTGGRVRRAGPFGCPGDTRDHGVEDGGIMEPGTDGDLVLFDPEGRVVEPEGA